MSRAVSPWLVATRVTCLRPDGSALLRDVSFSIANERVGLIGPNGSGKSTLLHLLAGDANGGSVAGGLSPSIEGAIERTGRFGVLTQRSTFGPEATIADLLGVAAPLAALARCDSGHATADDILCIGDRWNLVADVQQALGTFGLGYLPLDRPAQDVSGGERTRLRLAAILLDAPDLLLLDEPTNDIDATHRDAVYRLVADWPRGLLVATHDRALLEHVDRIVAIEQGGVRHYGGNWTMYVAEREAQQQAAQREQASALASRDRVRREQQAARERQARRDATGRREGARGGQARILLGMQKERSEGTGARLAGTIDRAHEEAEARVQEARARVDAHAAMVLPSASSGLAAGTLVVALRDAAIHVVPDHPLLQQVSLEVRGPERIALVGDNGSGKSTLLRVLAGQHPVLESSLYRGVSLTSVVYLDQHVTLLDGHHTVLGAMRAASAARGELVADEALRGALARFGFRAEQAERRVTQLSGGERMRAALACVLGVPDGSAPRLLLLDEPTNHLDLVSLQAVESALRGYDGALVVASHDRHFLEAIGITRFEPVARWHAHTMSGDPGYPDA
jgi:ATPase subunit of ABC transporter with duplicated ATPase domains